MWKNNFLKRNQYVIIYGSILSNFSECLKYSIIKQLQQNSSGDCEADSWHLGIPTLDAS